MKYKKLLTLSLLAIFVTSCNKESFKVPKNVELSVDDIASSVKIHTLEQFELLTSDDPISLVDNNPSKYGKTSNSSPLPVSFSWSEENDIEQAASKYVLRISESSNMSDPLEFTTKENSYDVYNLKVNMPYYYQIKSVHHQKSFFSDVKEFTIDDIAPRNIFVEGVENVRDLGGWNTSGHYYIKQGMIYRTAQFNYGGSLNSFVSAPTKAGKETLLKELKIKTDIDLRKTIAFNDEDEVNGIKSSPLGSKVKYVSCPMIYGNSNIFTRSENIPSIKAFFDTLAEPSNYPIAFHCVRGTDRTGALAYVLGALLGMSEEDLILDYLFSDLANISNPVFYSTISGDNFYVQGIRNAEGDSLSEKAKSYLHETVGVDFSTLDAIINLLTV